ncbi:MAG: metal-dependent transcriptional regulator [Lachnospiraceae bacterium]|nr:metal-dependent transcriptional regulator [Lachnospiraceae bacterium]
MALLESGEMYLESIHVLSMTSNNVRAIDIGEYMGFSKPSVSRAVGILIKDGYITRDEDGSIKLTKSGEKIAKRIYERHTVLTRLLISIGVDEKTAAEDACRVEHYISEKTFNAIKSHIKKQK